MTAMTADMEDAVLDHFLGTASFTMPAQCYLALYTTTPAGPDGTGGVEVTGGAYARQAVDFNVAVAGTAANAAQLDFPTATAGWGTVNGFGIFNSLAGIMLIYGAWDSPKTININDIFRLPAGNLAISAD